MSGCPGQAIKGDGVGTLGRRGFIEAKQDLIKDSLLEDFASSIEQVLTVDNLRLPGSTHGRSCIKITVNAVLVRVS